MDQQDRTAAPHHAKRRNGRIVSLGQQTGDTATRPCRQPASARLSPKEIEGVPREQLEMDGEGRTLEVHPPTFGLLDSSADLPLYLRRREGKPLVGAARTHAKRLGLNAGEIRED